MRLVRAGSRRRAMTGARPHGTVPVLRPPRLPESAASNDVVVTGESRPLRRELGVVAWSVLEDISHDARWDGSACVAVSNVRRIAEHLGVSEDTAARAVVRLVAVGLVVRMPAARSTAGTWGQRRQTSGVVPGLRCLRRARRDRSSGPHRTGSRGSAQTSRPGPRPRRRGPHRVDGSSPDQGWAWRWWSSGTCGWAWARDWCWCRCV